MTARQVLDPLVEVYEIDLDTVVLAADDLFLLLSGDRVARHLAAFARGDANAPVRGLADALAAHNLLVEHPGPRQQPEVPARYTATSTACARLAENLGELPGHLQFHVLVSSEWSQPGDVPGEPWMLVCPGARSVTVSPLFGRGLTPCWSCVRARLAARDDRRSTLRRTSVSRAAVNEDRWFDPEIVRRVRAAIEDSASAAPHAGLLHRVAETTTAHPVLPLPNCPVCASTPGRRVPAALDEVLDPVTGIVADRHASITGSGIAVAVATYADPTGGEAEPRFAYGAATSVPEARARARSEALERYCAIGRPSDGDLVATLTELGDIAVHPNDIMRFAADQLTHAPPTLYPPDAPIRWSRVRSPEGQERMVATGLCVALPPGCPDNRYCVYDSTGTAAATARDVAAVRAFLEVIERDAVAIWWYNRLCRPAVDPSSFGDGDIDVVVAGLGEVSTRLTVYEVTSDIPVPVFAALALRPGSSVPHLGFGAHFDAARAVRAALMELFQAVCFPARDERLWSGFGWSGQPQLADVAPTRTAGDYDPFAREPTVGDCASAAPAPILVFDFARDDVPVECVRVFVPGCHGLAPRFAPGRITEVPVRLGLRDRPAVHFNPERLRS